MVSLPSFALFPIATWRDQIVPDEWVSCLNAWAVLVESHLSLPENDFVTVSLKDESLRGFLVSFAREVAANGTACLGPSQSAKRLLKGCLLLVTKILQSPSPPKSLLEWEFLADLSRIYGKKAEPVFSQLSTTARELLDVSLSELKKFLIKNLDAGLKGGNLKAIEERLEHVNDLIRVSPAVAEFFLTGSDFLDGLISCYKIANPPLRKALIATTYLCLMGVADGQKLSALSDQLYSLKAAGAAHKSGPLSEDGSLVVELVTSTPLLQRLQHKLNTSESSSSRLTSVLKALSSFKKPNSTITKPKRLIRRRIDKGKAPIRSLDSFPSDQQQEDIHLLSLISQVQDLFPDLGAGFIARLLQEYSNSPEQAIAHLLDDSLPPHLASADRSEPLASFKQPAHPPPHPDTPEFNPADELSDSDIEILTAATQNKLHLGKRRLSASLPAAPSKQTILSALAAFDSDDDERDDTYDAADVGGTIDARPEDAELVAAETGSLTGVPVDVEMVLARTWLANPGVFARDATTRRSKERAKLREEAGGMTDEAVEGWAVMVQRDDGLRRKVERRYGGLGKGAKAHDGAGIQDVIIERTKWRAGDDATEGTEGTEDTEEGEGDEEAGRGAGVRVGVSGAGRGRGRGRGGRGRGGGRGGGGQPSSGGPAVDRRRKEANKASRANHNRRDQRARKMFKAAGLGG